jgi:hypothetical protein
MKTNVKPMMRIGTFAVAMLLAIGFVGSAASAAPKSETVTLQGATSAAVEIHMHQGELNLDGAAATDDILDAEFQFNGDDWAPEVSYGVDGAEGQLKIEQGDGGGVLGHWPWDDGDSVWDLRLNSVVPTDLNVRLGAGTSDLNLSELNLDTLDVDLGAGETMVDLTGARQHDVLANVKGDAGRLTLKLPNDVGVRVEVDSGIGSVDEIGMHKDGDVYVNDAYGAAPFTIDIKLDLRVGDVNLEVVT